MACAVLHSRRAALCAPLILPLTCPPLAPPALPQVLGLGDVYLGAPCAVPVDPRHRLVTAKYNPARTFTAEGTVSGATAHHC